MQKKAGIFCLEWQLTKHYAHKIMTCNFFQLLNDDMRHVLCFYTRGAIIKYRFRAQFIPCSSQGKLQEMYMAKTHFPDYFNLSEKSRVWNM